MKKAVVALTLLIIVAGGGFVLSSTVDQGDWVVNSACCTDVDDETSLE